jgi:hypothetical protein
VAALQTDSADRPYARFAAKEIQRSQKKLHEGAHETDGAVQAQKRRARRTVRQKARQTARQTVR